MDYHLLALIEQSDDSDFNSDTELPTVISGLSEIQVRGPLTNQARFKDRQFRPGEIRSGRLTGNPEDRGLVPVGTVAQTSTTESIVSQPLRTDASGVTQPLTGAVPRRQAQPKTPKTKKAAPKAPKKSKAPTAPSQEDLEFKDFYVDDQNPVGSYFTPDNKYLGWAAQFERKLRGVLPKTPPPPPPPQAPPINPDLPETRPPTYDQIMAEGGGIPGDGIPGEEG